MTINIISSIELDKIKTDLNWLHGKIGEYLRASYLKGKDEELKRLWKLYGDYRNRLNELDENLFGSLRKLEPGKPEMGFDNHYAEWGGLLSKENDLRPLADEVYKATQYLFIYESNLQKVEKKSDAIVSLKLIAKKFRNISRQLLERHGDRPTLEIDDEYDVQDLLHALLMLFFDDIRKEEWTPSYAGGASRMDYLLKNESIVVEVKKTRKGLDAKTVGDQLLIDIARYEVHPGCKSLFCFVYDSEGKIANPIGLENDLSKPHGTLNVIVLVEPK